MDVVVGGIIDCANGLAHAFTNIAWPENPCIWSNFLARRLLEDLVNKLFGIQLIVAICKDLAQNTADDLLVVIRLACKEHI